MQNYTLTPRQARRFMLSWQGLWGPHRFVKKEGALGFVHQAGCVQYDPVDLCGKNAELVLFSRVRGFQRPMLTRLLYKERALVDHWDKNMSLCPAEDWPALSRNRRRFWPEEGFRPSRAFWARLRRRLEQLARFNGCERADVLFETA